LIEPPWQVWGKHFILPRRKLVAMAPLLLAAAAAPLATARASSRYAPTLVPITLTPTTPFAFGCAGPEDPVLLENFTQFLFATLGLPSSSRRATLAWDDANGPSGWNGNASANVYIKYQTPALYYQYNEPLGEAAKATLQRLDAAGIYNSFQVGEWGSGFHCLTPAEQPGADPGCGAWEHGTSAPGSCGPSEYVAPTVDCSTTPSHPAGVPNCSTVGLGRNPHNLSEAYHYVKENYMRRQRFVQYDGPGGGTHSTPGYSYFTHEPARWGSKLVGFEVGENIENAQTHVALSRGSSRQRGVPWHMQLSPWHGASETSLCPDGARICTDPGGSTCGGPDAGHSETFLRRMFIYHWLAGSALNTAECCSCYGFAKRDGSIWPGPNKTTWAENPAQWADGPGEMLRRTFVDIYAKRDRGVNHAPLAILIDSYGGYGGSIW